MAKKMFIRGRFTGNSEVVVKPEVFDYMISDTNTITDTNPIIACFDADKLEEAKGLFDYIKLETDDPTKIFRMCTNVVGYRNFMSGPRIVIIPIDLQPDATSDNWFGIDASGQVVAEFSHNMIMINEDAEPEDMVGDVKEPWKSVPMYWNLED